MNEILTMTALIFLGTIVSYLLIVGIPFFFFCVKEAKSLSRFKIREFTSQAKITRFETIQTIKTFIVILGCTFLTVLIADKGIGNQYFEISKYGYLYYAASIVGIILIHDAYFFWTHLLMHRVKWLYECHKVHHYSHNPSPLSAFSFHEVEALVHFIFFPLAALILPVHFSVLGILFIFMLMCNSAGHLGYEFYPQNLYKTPITKQFNAATHHNMHHQYVNYNFSLYYNWWDRWLGTNHPEYFTNYDEIKSKAKDSKDSSSNSQAPVKPTLSPL